MKRYIVLLGVLLYCIMLKAQTETYACRYWFDQNHAQAVTTTFSDSTWQTELDIGPLAEGIHKLCLQVADTSMKWSAPQTYLFFKTADSLQEGLTCRYWFDQNHVQRQHLPFGNGHLLLNISDLEDGIHTVNILLDGNNLTTTQSYSFVKVAVVGLDSLDMSHLMYHCWFDQDYEHRQTDSVGDGHFLLDVSELTDGLHTVNVLLESDALTTTTSYMFMKVAVQDPTAEARYRCWFDNNYSTIQTGLLGSGCFQLELDELTKGFHTVNVQLDNGRTPSAPQTYMFYKQPLGGFGVVRWAYWLNDETNNKIVIDFVLPMDTLDIISLLPIETWPIRSTCFHFHPNGEEPYINAKNKISFRFWDTEDYYIDQSAFYVDENVVENIVAEDIERNTTETIVAPRDNQIHWFKMGVGRGDYMSFQASKACTMQLFAPSGEEVYTASGPESILMNGLNVWENGTYYLAVHDVTGSGETVSITYNWLNRYTVASYDVHLVGNGGCSTITYQGNGFNNLLDAYFVNYRNDTIRQLDIGHESNTTTTISFNFYGENLGAYDAVFEFFEETIRINGALEVQEPVDIVLTSTVNNMWLYFKPNPITFTYTVTNNGNMSAYAVPIFVYIDSPTKDGISHIEFDGLDLPSLMDYFDLDSLSSTEIEELALFSLEEGEGHCFFMFPSIDENTGDSTFIRSNYFFMNLAPFETKTLTLKITADVPIEAWVAFPSDTISPLTFLSNREISGHYCCAQDFISCNLDVICSYIDLIELVVSAIPGLPYKVVASIASCICDVISLMNTQLSLLLCEGDDPSGFWDMLKRMNYSSMIGAAASCFTKKLLKGFSLKLYKILNLIQRLKTLLLSGVNASFDCSTLSMSSPNCPPGPPKGGQGIPVGSFDPNDIYGYLSESGSHYMRQEIQNVQYEIEFENDTTLATAAAHTIIVRDTLDATKFDLNSLAARSVTIGDKRLDLNGEQTFAHTLDLRPDIYVIAQVEQDYDPTTGIIQWTIQSLDPMTMEPTDDPNQGVLPVNYYGNGVGFIDYSIDIKEAFVDGTEISNRAGIIFDQEDQILTPVWTNIVDAVKPTSHIEEVTLMGDSLSFSFVSSDNRSGVCYHNLYYRNASTEQEWLVKKAQIHGNSFMLPFDSLQTSEYFVIAVDSAGNVEPMKMEAEVVVESNTPGYPFFVAGYGESTKAGWKFIASPIEGGIEATTVDNIFGATQYDLYRFDQSEESEWRNYKTNSFNLINGQAYLYATKEDKTLIFRGTYNDTDSHEVMLMYSDDNPTTAMRGWNLIGNPFTAPAYVGRSYYTMNEEGTTIEPVAVSEGCPIPACHGVMVKAETPAETVTFSRTAQRSSPNQGNIQIVVAQATMRGNIKQDKAVVSFNSNDPLEKFVFDESNTRVYIPQNGKDYAIAYAGKTGEVPVNFKAAKDGTYSLTVNADNKVFDYLHLIDNLTGADVDLSMEPSYTFEAKTTDYASRFRLVFFVSEEGDDMPFAFVNNGNIVVIGAQTDAVLQIVDMLGRVILCRDALRASAISTTGMTPGVYILRLINGDVVRTQKIVVE